MISGKRNFSRVATLLLGAGLALSSNLGCGGETGGAPNGIASALTRATVRVSSFTLTSGSIGAQTLTPVGHNLSPIGASFAPDTAQDPTKVDSQGIAGTLYPTRNSRSFRVVLKGAGSDLEDVVYYFDAYDPRANLFSPPPMAEGSGPDTVVAEESVKGVQTQVIRSYVALRQDADNPDKSFKDDDPRPSYWPLKPIESNGVPVKDASGNYAFAFADDKSDTAIPASKDIYLVDSAFTYIQPQNQKAVRNGLRNVVVQFFADPGTDITPSAGVQDVYDQIAADPSATDAAQKESGLLSSSLTNSYVFTADVVPGAKSISLTGQFAANNGDSGLVDTGTLDLTATNLPNRWGSVKFEAYEESYGFGKPSIVFSKIVNLTDTPAGSPNVQFDALVASLDPLASAGGPGAPSTASVKLPFANRQRILKVYATCYELPDASGAVLAQTVERGKYNGQADSQGGVDYAPYEPVVFIPTVQAQPSAAYSDNGVAAAGNAFNLLKTLGMMPAINGVSATVAPLSKGVPQAIVVKGTASPDARYAYNATPLPTPKSQTRTLSNVGFYFALDATTATTVQIGAASYANLSSFIETPTLPTNTSPGPGSLMWLKDTVGNKTTNFDQTTYTNPAAIIEFTPYYPRTGSSPSPSLFAATLLPTQGTTTGTVREVKR